MRTLMKVILASSWTLCVFFGPAWADVSWIETSQADFADGYVDPNLYCSWRATPGIDATQGAVEWSTRFDLDNNGYPDFVSVSYYSPYYIRIYFMGPSGVDSIKLLPVNERGGSCDFADLNLDGKGELIHSGASTNSCAIYWNGPNGITAGDTTLLPNNQTEAVYVADLDKDGYLDIVSPSYAGRVFVIYWGGSGYHYDASRSTIIPVSANMAFNVEGADFDGDGNLDLVCGGDTYMALRNLGHRSFSEQSSSFPRTTGSAVHGTSVGDLNNDGLVDVVFTQWVGGGFSDIYLNNGGWNFSRSTINNGNTYGGTALHDFNGDGYLDILYLTLAKPLTVYHNDGSGHFSDADTVVLNPKVLNPTGGTIIDANRDGNVDIFVNGMDSYSYLFYGPTFTRYDSFAVNGDHHGIFREPGNIRDRSPSAFYESNIHDSGLDSGFCSGSVQWTAYDERDYTPGTLPDPIGSEVKILARAGNTSTIGPSWTAWDTLHDGSVLPASLNHKRYLQYRAELWYQNPAYLPWLERIEFLLRPCETDTRFCEPIFDGFESGTLDARWAHLGNYDIVGTAHTGTFALQSRAGDYTNNHLLWWPDFWFTYGRITVWFNCAGADADGDIWITHDAIDTMDIHRDAYHFELHPLGTDNPRMRISHAVAGVDNTIDSIAPTPNRGEWFKSVVEFLPGGRVNFIVNDTDTMTWNDPIWSCSPNKQFILRNWITSTLIDDVLFEDIGPHLEVHDSLFCFDSTAVGATADSAVWLLNTGCDTMRIMSLGTPSAPFSWDPAPSMPILIAPGESLRVPASFSPTAVGDFTSTYMIYIFTGMGSCQYYATLCGHAYAPLCVPLTATLRDTATCEGSTVTLAPGVMGGLSPLSYHWSPGGQTTPSITVGAGTYTVIVSGSDGCADTVTATVSTWTRPTVTIPSQTPCVGQPTTYTAEVTGGTPGYAYLWSPGGQTSPAITITTPGNYTVIVADAHWCRDTATVAHFPAPPPYATINGSPVCGSGTTNIWATVTGAYSPFTYRWSTGATTDTITVGVGSYWIIATDTRGCVDTANYVVTTWPPPTVNVFPSVVCGGGTATLTAVASGGAPGYTYRWNTGATTPSITVGPGTYTVVATDVHGCSDTANGIISATPPPSVTVAPAMVCPGGTATLTAVTTGGVPPLQFHWSTGATTPAITAGMGSYTVIVTDSLGCADTARVDVIERIPPTVTLRDTAVCYQLTIVLEPGLSGYTPFHFLWSTGDTTPTISAPPGTYWLQVTDSNGCTARDTAVVDSLLPPVLLPVHRTVCLGGEAVVTAVHTGGMPPFTYRWSTGQTTQSDTVGPGTYWVVATDAYGCHDSVDVLVDTAPGLTVELPDTGVCTGGDSIHLDPLVSGGSGPYDYIWSTGATGTPLTVGPGQTVWVTVTDHNGCVGSDTTTVAAWPSPAFTVNSDSICEGDTTRLFPSVTAGTPPFRYLWSNGDTTQSIPMDHAAEKCLEMWDTHGCYGIACGTVTLYPSVALDLWGMEFCARDSGWLSAHSTNPNTVFIWDGVDTTDGIWVNDTALHYITGTDTVTGCVARDSIRAVVHSLPRVAVTADTACAGEAGQVCLRRTDPGEVHYAWIDRPETTSCITLTSDSVVCGYVYNDFGCASAQVCGGLFIRLRPPVVLPALSLCAGTASWLCVDPILPGATYSWDGIPGDTCLWVDLPGTYCVEVTDVNGCGGGPVCVEVVETPNLAVGITGHDICAGDSVELRATGGTPATVFTWTDLGLTGQRIWAHSGGTYYVMAEDTISHCMGNAWLTVNENPIPSATLGDQTTCTGDPLTFCLEGSPWAENAAWLGRWETTRCITVVDTGTICGFLYSTAGCSSSVVCGTASWRPLPWIALPDTTLAFGETLRYCPRWFGARLDCPGRWSTGSVDTCIDIISAGTYWYAVDCSTCTDVDTGVVDWILFGNVTLTGDTICAGDSVRLVPVTDVANTRYTWSTGATTPTILVRAEGWYRLTVTDSITMGTAMDSAFVRVLSLPVLTMDSASICAGGYTSICMNTTALLPQYYWDSGERTRCIDRGLAGTWCGYVVDGSTGCPSERECAALTVSANLSVSIDSIPACEGYTSILVAQCPTIGVTYTWGPGGERGDTLWSDTSGIYWVTVLDPTNGCTGSDTARAQFNAVPVLTVTGDTVCAGDSAFVTATSSIPGGNYRWDGGQTTGTIAVITAGVYHCVYTDSNGCQAEGGAAVVVNPRPTLTVNSDTICAGDSTILTATPSISGGTFLWTGGATTASITVSSAGTYTVDYTSAQGCHALPATGTVTVLQPPDSVHDVNPSRDTLVSAGDPLTLSWLGYGGTPPGMYDLTVDGVRVLTDSPETTWVMPGLACADSLRWQVTYRNVCGEVMGPIGLIAAYPCDTASARLDSTWFWEETDCDGENVVHLCYVLSGDTTATVTVRLSEDDGATWTVPLLTLTNVVGDTGVGVLPGTHCFEWLMSADWYAHEGRCWRLEVATVEFGDTVHATSPLDADPPVVTLQCPDPLTVGQSWTFRWTVADTFWQSDPCSIRVAGCGLSEVQLVSGTSLAWTAPLAACPACTVIVSVRDSFCNWGADTCVFPVRALPVGPVANEIRPVNSIISACADQGQTILLTDPDGIDPGSIVIRVNDAVHRIGDGQTTFSNDTLTYQPAPPWADGETVTVCVDSVRDLLGAPLQNPHCWTFQMDLSPPVAVLTEPSGDSCLWEMPSQAVLYITDSLSGVNWDSLDLWVNGGQVLHSDAGPDGRIDLLLSASGVVVQPGETLTIRVRALDQPTATYCPPNDAEWTWRFTICPRQLYPCTALPRPFVPDDDGNNEYVQFEFPDMTQKAGVVSIYTSRNYEVIKIPVPEGPGAREIARWRGRDRENREAKEGLYLYIIEVDGQVVCHGTLVLAR